MDNKREASNARSETWRQSAKAFDEHVAKWLAVAVQKEVPGPTRGLTGESGRSSSVPRKATTSFSLRSP